jgi:cbb3-type cytochrome oxidase subunit 1
VRIADATRPIEAARAVPTHRRQAMGLHFIKIAVVYLVIGTMLGAWMGSIQTFTYAPVHAHILLLGWVSLAMAGVIYHLYPAASETRLAKAHFWIHNLVLPPFMVVLALFLTGTKAAGPVLGIASVVMIVGLACFMVNVLTNAKPAG